MSWPGGDRCRRHPGPGNATARHGSAAQAGPRRVPAPGPAGSVTTTDTGRAVISSSAGALTIAVELGPQPLLVVTDQRPEPGVHWSRPEGRADVPVAPAPPSHLLARSPEPLDVCQMV